MEHQGLSSRSTSSCLLRELDEQLAAAVAALTGPHPSVDAASEHLLRGRQVLEQLREQADDGAASTPPPDTIALVRRLELPPRRASARRARDFAGSTCQSWALPAPVRNAAVDIASELVANAAAHGGGPVVLALERGAGNLLVRVWDDGPGLPRVLPYRPGLSEKGLGLRLVKQLSTHWGAAAEDGGKWVWARIALPGPDGT